MTPAILVFLLDVMNFADLGLDNLSFFLVHLTLLLQDVQLLLKSKFIVLLLLEVVDGVLQSQSGLVLIL